MNLVSEFLFIRPGLVSPRDYVWLVYDEQSDNVLSSGVVYSLQELANLKTQLSTNQVVIMYASDTLLFKKIEYPSRISSKNSNLLLYAVEEELADDIDDLDVRIINKSKNTYYTVIYKKSEIKTIEETFKNMGFDICSIVPDIFGLPYDDKAPTNEESKSSEDESQDIPKTKLYAMQIEDKWIIRDSMFSGFSVDDEWFDFVEEDYPSDQYNLISLSSLDGHNCDGWSENLISSPLESFVKNILSSKFKLLVGKRKRLQVDLKLVKPWYKVCLVLLAIFVVWLISALIQIHKYDASVIEIKKLEQKLYQQITGKSKTVKDPVDEIKNIIAFTNVDNSEEFVSNASLLFPLLTVRKEISIQSMEFSRNDRSFIVSFTTQPGFDTSAFIKYMADNSFKAEIKSVKSDDNVSTYFVSFVYMED